MAVCVALLLRTGFEWRDGYTKRFGLHYVQYSNATRRIPKQSASWFSKLVTTGNIPSVPTRP